MEILKIHANPIAKHGDIDWEAGRRRPVVHYLLRIIYECVLSLSVKFCIRMRFCVRVYVLIVGTALEIVHVFYPLHQILYARRFYVISDFCAHVSILVCVHIHFMYECMFE